MRLLFGKPCPNFGKRCSMSKSTFGGGDCQAPLSLNPLTRFLLRAYASHHATHVLVGVQARPSHAEMNVRDLGLARGGMGGGKKLQLHSLLQGPGAGRTRTPRENLTAKDIPAQKAGTYRPSLKGFSEIPLPSLQTAHRSSHSVPVRNLKEPSNFKPDVTISISNSTIHAPPPGSLRGSAI